MLFFEILTTIIFSIIQEYIYYYKNLLTDEDQTLPSSDFFIITRMTISAKYFSNSKHEFYIYIFSIPNMVSSTIFQGEWEIANVII